MSAVQVDGDVTALGIMPQRGENKIARYFVAGDSKGKLFAFRPDGDLMLESSASNAAVTSIATMPVRRNETLVVSGHADGRVVFHRVRESVHRDDPLVSDQLNALSSEIFATADASSATPAAAAGAGVDANANAKRRAASYSSSDAAPAGEEEDEDANAPVPRGRTTRGDGRAVTRVETYRFGAVSFVAASRADGAVVVYKAHDGALHAVFPPERGDERVVAFKQGGRKVISWLTSTRAVAVDPITLDRWSTTCDDARGFHRDGDGDGDGDGDASSSSALLRAKFDVVATAKFYAVSERGSLVSGWMTAEHGRVACERRGERALTGLDVWRGGGASVDGAAVAVATIKGYAFIATATDVAAVNVTSTGRRTHPRDAVGSDLPSLARMFGRDLAGGSGSGSGSDGGDGDDDDDGAPALGPGLVASNRGRLVVVAFPDGLVASYESDLFVRCVLYKSFSPVARFQHLIASPFN